MAELQLKELEDLYDKKISEYFELARAFREERNAHCSVTRNLPAEVLSTIFAWLASICKNEVQKHSHLRWMVVTHVCRVWRNVALKEPTLWTDFTDLHPNWVREMFARSMAAPLILQYDQNINQSNPLDFVFQHVIESPERIKELEIYVKDDFVDLLVKPAPFLEDLFTDSGVELPPNFLAGVAPRLHSLTCGEDLPLEVPWLGNLRKLVYQGRLHPTATYLSKLTFLELDWDWVDEDSTVYNIDIILSALENMPLLQHLSLSLSSQVGDVFGSRSVPVHLPYLRDITVCFSRTTGVAAIFDYLQVNNIERLVTRWPPNQDLTMVTPVCHFFERYYHGDNLQYLLHSKKEVTFHRTHSNGAHTPVLTFRFLAQPPSLAGVVGLLPRCTPHVYAIHQDSFKIEPPPTLAACDTIEELHISFGYLHPNFFDPFDASTPPYPSLRRLYLHDLCFIHISEQVYKLKRWISASRIEHLTLTKCSLREEDIAPLQEVVAVTVLADAT
ncbi:hypothetical protein EYR38_004097 [Pleurotus pulmonarius]|nr:hypothetical protein EYR38_004097 [Pleurotus pulmonarius]